MKKLLFLLYLTVLPLAVVAQEPYAVLSDNNTKLTFYYDKKKASRGGMSVGPFRSYNQVSWYDERLSITTVEFNVSFASCTTLTSTANWFYDCRNIETIKDIEYLTTSNVTDMSNMFHQCFELKTLNVSHFDTRKVTNMTWMFGWCKALTSLDVSHFNTSNVTSMGFMFYYCSSLSSLDVSLFDTRNVTTMYGMFGGCSSLTSLDVSHFDTSKVQYMNDMFTDCSSLTSLDVSHFNTTNVKNMDQMFSVCSSLKKLDVSHFDTSNVTGMCRMFAGCSKLTNLDVTHFDTSNVTNMSRMFGWLENMNSLDLSNFDTGKVKNMEAMYYYCRKLTAIYVCDSWSTANVTSGDEMFYLCTSLVGGNGTSYDGNHTDHTYARVDKEGTPGYFTHKNSTIPVSDFITVEGGTFMMGATDGWGYDDERPVHEVTVPTFAISKHEVTQKLWKTVMGGENPSTILGDDLPVNNLSWNDCQIFIRRLNSLTKMDFGLPTEAEWEFAARGGLLGQDKGTGNGYQYAGGYNDIESMDAYTWHSENSNGTTHAVGTKKPNELGLYDMSGNVCEYVADYFSWSYDGEPTTSLVFRGGSYQRPTWQCRLASRFGEAPDEKREECGLRLVLRPGGENSCDLSDLPTTNAYYASTAFLCERGVLSGSKVNGRTDVTGKLLRAHLAKIAFRGVYLLNGRQVPQQVVSDDFPTVYDDLAVKTLYNDYYYQAARALLYLEYGDGTTPFDRNRLKFEPEGTISRVNVLKALMETFNIKPDLEGTDNPFPNDPDVVAMAASNPVRMGYVRKAAALGIITTSNQKFRPYDDCLRGEAFTMLARIMQKIEAGDIADPNPQAKDYFQPLNTTLATVSLGAGLQMGNFRHYTKTSFALNGLIPLAFAHTYNSYNTTLPSQFFGARTTDNTEVTYQPLGDGWSHNYHSFITVVGSLGANGSSEGMRAIVHWGGGSIDVYKSQNGQLVPESMGVYDDFTLEGSVAVIKTKSQMEYRFYSEGGGGAAVLYLNSIKDRNGNTLVINYEDGVNGGKRIKSVSGGRRSLKFTYLSGTDLLSKVTDPLSRSVKFTYYDNKQTGRKQLRTFTDAEGNRTIYDYADQTKAGTSKLLKRIKLPKGNYIENKYDANRRLSQTVSGVNNVPTTKTSVSVAASYGNGSASTQSTVTVERDASQPSTYHYTYNGNNVMTAMTGEKGLYMNNTYGNADHPELPTAIKNNSTEVSGITYDAKGNVTRINVKGDGTTLTTKMTYDGMNNLTSVTDPMGNKTTYTYDAKGNLTKVTEPESVVTKLTVNENGQVTTATNPMGVKTNFAYNSYGNMTKATLPALGISSSAEYDDASRLISVTDAMNRTTAFAYNKNDFLTSETDAMSHTTSYAYDANGNLTTITNAKGGVTTMTYDNATDWLLSVEFAGATKQYAYNQDGTLADFTKPDGTTLSYSYDELGRVTSDGVNSYEYDDKLRLKSVTGGGKTLSLTYDGFNRITATSCGGNSNSYTYDKNGNRTSVNNTTYGYDKLNRLTSVTFSGKTISYTYRKDSKLETVAYPNGMTTTYGYDNAGRLTSKQTTLANGTVVTGYSYVLDKMGNILEQTEQEPYNDVVQDDEDVDYTYTSGNRIKKAGDISFTFDANGNTTKRGSEKYSWDALDRLTKAGSTSITYDPLGLIASYGSTTFTTDPLGMGNVLSDSKSGATYIYGNGLEARVKNGRASYYVTDVRGSVIAIVDESGNITHKYQYDEFGKVVQKQEADYNPFQFVGKYGVMYLTDHQYYMRARHYDPTIGRFLSEDPIWSTNLYPYADNNPVMKIDANGRASAEPEENIDEWLEKMLEDIDDTPQPIDQDQLSQDMFDDMVNGDAFVGGKAKPSAGNTKINYLEHIPYNTIGTTYKEVKNWGHGQTLGHIGNIAEAVSRDGVSSVVKLSYHGPFRDEFASGAQWAVSKSIEGYRMLVDVTLGDAMDRYYMNKYNK